MVLYDPEAFGFKSEEEINNDLLVSKARSAAIRMIGIGRKSSGTVKHLLLKQDFPLEIINQVLKGLQEDQYIDDYRLAKAKIKPRTGAKSESKARTAQRLSQLGIERQAVEDSLSDHPDDYSLALVALQSKYEHHFKNGFEAVSPEQLMKMRRFLFSRGFSSEVSRDTIRTYLKGRLYEDDDT